MNAICQIVGPHVSEGRKEYYSNLKNKLDKKIALHHDLHMHKLNDLKLLEKNQKRCLKKNIDFTNSESLDELKNKINEIDLKLKNTNEKLNNVVKKIKRLKHNEKRATKKLTNTNEGFHHSCKEISDKIHHTFEDIEEKFEDIIKEHFPIHTPSNPPSNSFLPPERLVTVYNANYRSKLPGTLIFSLDQKVDKKNLIGKQAFDNAINVLKFWQNSLQMHSYNNHDAPIKTVIHYLKEYDNAFFDGKEMVYGDGDDIFGPFVNWLDIAGHEMGHALIGDKLVYNSESGALNESFADIMGAFTNMVTNNIKAKDYHWLVGKDLIRIPIKVKNKNGTSTFHYNTYSLRSFKEPGSAYPYLKELGGKDPQPSVYSEVNSNDSSDDYGVHINSGIPNHVFWLLTQKLDETQAFSFWYDILVNVNKNPNITFTELANLQIATAKERKLEDLTEALKEAWTKVEVPFDSPLHIIELPVEIHPSEENLMNDSQINQKNDINLLVNSQVIQENQEILT